jgi:hypothetical protein
MIGKHRLKKFFRQCRSNLRALQNLAFVLAARLNIISLPFYCPVCQRRIYKWLPFRRNIGKLKRRLEPGGRLCPYCRSLERTRHFIIYLEKNNILDSKPRFLHFAPEEGLEPRLRSLLKNNYVTTDLYKAGVDRKEDITNMSFDNNSFDFIYCSNVLEHVKDDKSAMAELYRVLAPGGTAIIQVPIGGNTTYEDDFIIDCVERAQHFGQADHVRLYGRDIFYRLSDAGFSVEELFMPDVLNISDEEITRMNLNKREIAHKCMKVN